MPVWIMRYEAECLVFVPWFAPTRCTITSIAGFSPSIPEKLRRNTKQKRDKETKRILGKNIEKRSESIADRKEFGHWELDSVIGKVKLVS